MGIRIREQVVAMALGIVLSTATLAAVNVGQPAPGFSGIDTRGQRIALEDYRGQVVVFNGSNGGPEATAIYERWAAQNRHTCRSSGSMNCRSA